MKLSKILLLACLIVAIGVLAACSSSNLPYSGDTRSSTVPRSSAMPQQSPIIRATPPVPSSNIREAPAERESAGQTSVRTHPTRHVIRRADAVIHRHWPVPESPPPKPDKWSQFTDDQVYALVCRHLGVDRLALPTTRQELILWLEHTWRLGV